MDDLMDFYLVYRKLFYDYLIQFLLIFVLFLFFSVFLNESSSQSGVTSQVSFLFFLRFRVSYDIDCPIGDEESQSVSPSVIYLLIVRNFKNFLGLNVCTNFGEVFCY